MKIIFAIALVCACESGSLAQIARAPDVDTCKPLGVAEVVGQTADARIDALRRKSAQLGATHVIPDANDGTTLKGRMYACPIEDDSTSRASRSQFSP